MTQQHEDPALSYGDAVRSDAARLRERERRRYSSRRGRGTWIWWAVTMFGLVLFAALMWAVMEKTKWTAGDVARRDGAATPARVNPASTSARPLIAGRKRRLPG
ncbi:hypothetical protein [Lysobacter claricitrinus]|uniref:hypothetical protein n=1 Tax=Lysobacter claricitrinus TaxID=3367728 RepID=UPI0037DA7CDA